MVERTKVTVEITTTLMEVKAKIWARVEVSGYSVRFHRNFLPRPNELGPKSSTVILSIYLKSPL